MRPLSLALLLTIFCAVLSLRPALAQTADQVSAKFKEADTNHDGKLTLEEAKAGMPKIAAHFNDIDRGHKGYVTLDDILTKLGLAK